MRRAVLVFTLFLGSLQSLAVEVNLSATTSVAPTIVYSCPVRDVFACAESACERLWPGQCSGESEFEDMMRVCKGNYGRECFDYICEQVGDLGCSRQRDVVEVVQACRGNISHSCIEKTCAKNEFVGCPSKKRLLEVARLCSGL